MGNGCDLGFFSHFPVLAGVLARTWGTVLEFGCGWGSSPLIHYGAVLTGRKVIAADTDLDWLTKFSGYSNRESIHIEGKDVIEKIDAWCKFASQCLSRLEPGVSAAFLDMAPGEARVPVAKILRSHARFIVCHDREADEPPGGGNYGWKELDGVFRYQAVMKRLRPWTAVYSDFELFPLDPIDAEDERP